MRIIQDTEGISIEDYLFDDCDTQAIKNISKEITEVVKPDETVFYDIDFELIETITIPDNMETILKMTMIYHQMTV